MAANDRLTSTVPVIGVVARSGTGKTTLLSQLISLLHRQGLRVGIVKHTHHDIEIDKPGKDSYVLRKAGAAQTLLAARQRAALVVEHDPPLKDVRLQECIDLLDTRRLDLILVEGFKQEAIPKIELQRAALEQAPIYPEDRNVIAVASDIPSPAQCAIAWLDINNPLQICDFILAYINNPDRHESD